MSRWLYATCAQVAGQCVADALGWEVDHVLPSARAAGDISAERGAPLWLLCQGVITQERRGGSRSAARRAPLRRLPSHRFDRTHHREKPDEQSGV